MGGVYLVLLSTFLWHLPVPSAAQGGGDYRLLLDEFASYPYGESYAMTSTPDGKQLYAAEGGTISFIDADPDTAGAQNNYRFEVKRLPVGQRGVVPVRMIHDDAYDLLYIAGGRDGLWLMDASFDPQVENLAWRVDDKGNQGDITKQKSRKWCDDLFRVTLGQGTAKREYLVALFAKRDASHLCFYWMDDVRAIALGGAAQETGTEIQSRYFTILPTRPSPPSAAANFAYPFAMDVDPQYNATLDEDKADIYLAMGQHGILRVQARQDASGAVVTSSSWGPYFGDNSQYAQQVDPELYGDVMFFKGSQAPIDAGALMAQHAPFFLDVAVDRRAAPGHRLYAAVDNVGVVSFDLEAPWSSFIHGPGPPPLFHQEGVKTAVAGKWAARLVSDPVNPNFLPYAYTFARSVQITETVVDGAASAALIVGALPTMFTKNPADQSHGRSHDYVGRALGGIPGNLSGQPAWGMPAWESEKEHEYTIVYDLTAAPTWTSGAINSNGFSRIGSVVHAFSGQLADSLSYYVSGQADASKLPASADD